MLLFSREFGGGQDVPGCGKYGLECRGPSIANEVVCHVLAVLGATEGVVIVAIVGGAAPTSGKAGGILDG